MATEIAPETYPCHVCGESAIASAMTECNWCDQRFHLNQRNDVEAQDCGEVWIDEQYLALQFACNKCLAGGDAQSPASLSRAAATATVQPSPRQRRYKRRP